MTPFARRTFLRGASGAMLTLPWLESLQAAATAAGTPPRRAVFIYVPTGVIREEFFPGEQTDPERVYRGPHPHTSSRTLRPLDPIAHKVTLVTNMDRVWMDASDQHEQCGCCWLSSIDPRTHATSRMPQGRTIDHYLADRIGADTPFRTLEFNCNPHHDNRESIHYDSISWYGPDHSAGNMRDPLQAYRRLFTGGTTAPSQRVTDLVLADARTMAARLGGADRRKLGEYLESIRAIERQMDRLAAVQAELDRLDLAEPSAAHLPRSEYVGLFTDMLVAALQSGLTNVATLMIAPERWDTSYLFDGVSDKPLSHHLLSHAGWSEELRKIDEFHVRQFARLLEKMDAIREADGSTLLDNTILTYGSGLGQGAKHLYDRLPTIVAGGGGGRIKTGFHLECEPGTPLANLWLAQARALGVELDGFADSTGVLEGILAG
jgi:hypothetical protein